MSGRQGEFCPLLRAREVYYHPASSFHGTELDSSELPWCGMVRPGMIGRSSRFGFAGVS